jgi:hypothetical protein
MKRLLYTGLIFVMSISFTGCYKDVIFPEVAFDPDGR